jgi:hypothetical protein
MFTMSALETIADSLIAAGYALKLLGAAFR